MAIGLSQETPWKGEEEPERFLELLRVIAASHMGKQAGSFSAWPGHVDTRDEARHTK